MSHLRYSGLSHGRQCAVLDGILRADPIVWPALEKARDLELPDWMIVAGAVYNTVWNALTGRPPGHGLKDIDLFYHDASDLSWEAEDAVIRRGAAHFAGTAVPVEIRNQARVHLWYPHRFGRTCPPYESSTHSLGFFASKTHAIGVRLDGHGLLEVVAPFGLEPMFAMRIEPNRKLQNSPAYEEKGARARTNWPEVELIPW